jgi:hypothetical protein
MRSLFLCSFLWVGCSEPQPGCTPGASVACTCTDGSAGAQSCKADRTFDVCMCDSSGRTSVVGGNNNNNVVGTRRVFVTATSYSVNAISTACQQSADAVGLGGTWKPWLSTSTLNAIDSIRGDGPFVNLKGNVVFKNHAQLATAPTGEIRFTENGNFIDDTYFMVWTGTTNGGISDENCHDWTASGGYFGMVGWPNTSGTWTSYNVESCDQYHSVYCFEQ